MTSGDEQISLSQLGTSSRPSRVPPVIDGDPAVSLDASAPHASAGDGSVPPPTHPDSEPPSPPPPTEAAKQQPAGSPVKAILLLVAGAIIAAAGAFGWEALRGPDQAAPAPGQELAGLKSRLDALEKKPVIAAATPEQLAALDRRVAGLEQRPAPPAVAPPVTEALGRLDGRIARVEALAGQAVEAARQAQQKVAGAAAGKPEAAPASLPPAPVPIAEPPFDPAPLQAQIVTLEQRLTPLEAMLASPKSEMRATEATVAPRNRVAEAAGLAVLADAILRSIDGGSPFKAELASARGLGADEARLAPLQAAADKGVADVPTLAASFKALAPAILATTAAPSSGEAGSLYERLAASVSGLVRVRPVGDAGGDDPAAVVARIEAALARGAVPAALAAWEHLPEPAKAASRTWADAARQRTAATVAARALLDEAITDIGRGGGAP